MVLRRLLAGRHHFPHLDPLRLQHASMCQRLFARSEIARDRRGLVVIRDQLDIPAATMNDANKARSHVLIR